MGAEHDDRGPGGSPPGRRPIRRALGLLAVLAVLLTAVVAPSAAQPTDPADTTFLVVLDESGDAEVTLQLAFDVSTEQDRRALDRLRTNRTTILAQFHGGMAAVAAGAENETGRSMDVSDPAMRVTAEGDRGVVELSVTWHGLAAVDGDRLRVTAPFDDGFESPGRFVIRAPEGYAVESVTPAPTDRSGTEATWAAGTRLDGFEATFLPDRATGGTPPQALPGFGVPAALVAIALVSGLAVLAARRRP